MAAKKNNPTLSLQVSAVLESYRKSSKHKVLFVSHHFGGGCERHIRELGAFLQEKIEVATIRSSESEGVTLRMGTDPRGAGFFFSLPQNYKHLLDLCKYLKISKVHYHHVMGMHPVIQNLAQDLGISWDITLHDFYFINSNPKLTDRSGRYCEEKSRDQLCAESHPIPENMSAAQWREKQSVFLKSAERIIIPSRYAADLYLDYFPDLNPIVVWHPDWEENSPYPSPRLRGLGENHAMRVALIGALTREKGSGLLDQCAKIAKKRSLPLEFHVIGYANRPLNPFITVHGWYEDKDLGALISKINPHIIWFPAQWPETYSYTLSAALEWGGPIVVPDIGAFQERVKGRSFTWVEPWDKSTNHWLDLFLHLRARMIKMENREETIMWKDQPEQKKGFLYASDYVTKSPETYARDTDARVLSIDWVHAFVDGNRRGIKEMILIHLLRITRNPLIAKLIDIVPYNKQQRIKRFFSRRPIHEIMR